MNAATRDSLMREAIAVCERGIAAGQGPFGAVIATAGGEIVTTAHNTVHLACDPTAHAEINAIRQASTSLETIDLSGHVLFTTCEPCPMCASAIHWARLDAVYYGATIHDAQAAGFNELALACEVVYESGGSSVQIHAGVLSDRCVALFERWRHGSHPTPY